MSIILGILMLWFLVGFAVLLWESRQRPPAPPSAVEPPSESTALPPASLASTASAWKSPKSVEQASESMAPPSTQPARRKIPTPLRLQYPQSNQRHYRNIVVGDRKLQKLREKVRGLDNPLAIVIGELRQFSPFEFEEVLLTCFEERGFEIQRNSRYTADGGIDGRIYFEGKLFLVQAKRYRNLIHPQHVKDFIQVIRRQHATGGFFVHTGRTSDLSRSLAKETTVRVVILSGERLVKFILGIPMKLH